MSGFGYIMLATAGLSLKDVDGVPTTNLLRAADDFKAGRLDATLFAIGAPKMAEVDAAIALLVTHAETVLGARLRGAGA